VEDFDIFAATGTDLPDYLYKFDFLTRLIYEPDFNFSKYMGYFVPESRISLPDKNHSKTPTKNQLSFLNT